MADVPASLESIHRVAGALERAHMVHAFIGGVALNVWGIPRATFDLDLAVAADGASVPRLLSELERSGCVVEAAFAHGFRDRVAGMEKIHLHLPTGSSLMAIDLFLAGTPFVRSVIERRVRVNLEQGDIQVCSAADLILFKLLADRPKDRVDVTNVLSVQGVPEREYLERWARELGVEKRLVEVLGGASA